MNFIAIIPARYASTRFPGKPLALLGEKSVIQRVYEQVTKQLPACVATDDQRIYDHVTSFGGNVVMTKTTHKSGTDRIEEAAEKLQNSNIQEFNISDDTVIVNVQGDEPFIQPEQIKTICDCFNDPNTDIATLGIKFKRIEDVKNPNSPKIILDNKGFAIYFSRSVIPYIRGKEESEWTQSFDFLKHIGMYAYRRRILKEITTLPQSSLELAESLEQLRWIQNGYKIKVGETKQETIGIDTPKDLEEAIKRLKNI